VVSRKKEKLDGSVISNASLVLLSIWFYEISSHRVSPSCPMVVSTMENLSMTNTTVMADLPLVVATNTMEPGRLIKGTDLGK
jgi:hypothetical protein